MRQAALFGLGQLAWDPRFSGGREGEVLGAVGPSLRDSHEGVRKAAAEAVGKLGVERAPELLAPLLADPEPAVRAETLLGLYRYRYVLWLRSSQKTSPPLPLGVLQRMLPLAKDRSEKVRRALVHGFVRFKDDRVLSMARELSNDPDEWTRLYSVLALATLADRSATAVVPARLRDSSPNVRRAAIQLAAAIDWPEAAERLRDDPDVHVRSLVAQVLAKVPRDPRGDVARWLRRMMDDRRVEVRSAAVRSLASCLEGEAVRDVHEALEDRNEYMRAAATAALAFLPPEDRKALLPIPLADSSLPVRAAVLELLAGDPGDEAFARIEKELVSEQVDVRGAAISALARRKEPRALELAWEAYCRNLGMRLEQLRESVVQVLAAFDGMASTNYLLEIRRDESYPVAMAAHDVLVGRGMKDLKPPEDRLTFSPYRDLPVPERPLLRLETARGTIAIRLFPELAPVHVANAVGLVRKGFFDGKSWHRVVPNFVIQGGAASPLGSEIQDWMLRAEVNPVRFGRGAVGMSRGDLFDTGDSEFFICHVPWPSLDGRYTYFGQVVSGLSVLDSIEAGDRILRASVHEAEAGLDSPGEE